eukprot:TRINITY_DN25026_c0_g1_i1.p1 TRINITY_DN25026_c0_g1~~TRINITY_DN25026_c0_g1_i1.p1  ORF type:complete len:493 (+),score=105.80 TRINITY_DN25026_c0_g1_i1:116-1594(+)
MLGERRRAVPSHGTRRLGGDATPSSASTAPAPGFNTGPFAGMVTTPSSGVPKRSVTPVRGSKEGENLTNLRLAVERCREELGGLRAEVSTCRDELLALSSCLVEARVLRAEQLHSSLRRSSSSRSSLQRPLRPVFSGAGLVSADTDPSKQRGYDVDLQVGLFAGPAALREAGQVSKVAGAASRNAWPEAVKLWPRHLFVCGGTSAQGPSLRSAERFNTSAGTWEYMPEMKAARGCASGGILGGSLYVCGGFVDDDDQGGEEDDNLVLSSVEQLEIGKDSWQLCPPMLGKRWGAASGVVGGKLYVCGGYDDKRGALSSVERFDPETQEWQLMRPMSKQRARAAAAVHAGRLYVCGGFNGMQLLSSAEYFDAASDLWHPLPSMSSARYIASAAAVNGKVYVCGGVGKDGEAMASAERFDPATVVWEAMAPMSVARYGACAVSATGALFVFGGNGLKLRLSSVEKYDPDAGRWEPLLPMLLRRSGAVAVSCVAKA